MTTHGNGSVQQPAGSSQEPRSRRPTSWWPTLWRSALWAARHDGWVRLAAIGAVFGTALPHAGVLGARLFPFSLPALFLLVPLACLHGVRRLRHAAERRFWIAFAAALLCRWLVLVGNTIAGALGSSSSLLVLVNAIGLGAFYLLLLAAVARRPHAAAWRSASLERLVIWPTAVLLVTSLLAYFVLLPRAFATGSSSGLATSELPFVVLDLYLAVQLALFARETRGSSWFLTYLLLGLTSAVWLLDDIRRTIAVVQGEASEPAIWAMMVWLFAAVLAARLRHLGPHPPTQPIATDERIERRLSDDELLLAIEARAPQAASHTLAAAVSLPILHVICSRFDFFPSELRAPHDVLLLFALAAFGAFAWLQHSILRRAVGALHRARSQSEDAVRRHLVDLQLQRERLRAETAVRAVEDRFATVFRACPTAMLITSLESGRIIDINESFEALTGYRRHECIGTTAEALGLWEHPEDRPIWVSKILAGQAEQDVRTRFRLRDGTWCPFLVGATRIELGDSPGILALARPDPALPQPTVLEQSGTAMLGVDASLSVSMWSEGMGKLVGLSAASAVGQPLAKLLPRTAAVLAPLVKRAAGPVLQTTRIELEKDATIVLPLMAHMLPIPEDDGRFGCFLVIDPPEPGQ